MNIFNRLDFNDTCRRMLLGLLSVFVLSACASTRTFEDAGVYKGESYTISITREDEGLFREYSISINGDLVLTIDREETKAAPCQKMSLYVSRCTYETQYQGIAVRVIQEIDAQMFQQNAYYSIYFDGVLVRRVTTPLL